MNNEPNMEQIEDYHGKEGKEKRNTVIFVIIILLIIGAIYSTFLQTFNVADDKIVDAPDLVKRF